MVYDSLKLTCWLLSTPAVVHLFSERLKPISLITPLAMVLTALNYVAAHRIVKSLLSSLILPSAMMAWPRVDLDSAVWQSVKVPVRGAKAGVQLDAAVWINRADTGVDPAKKRWILFLNPNGVAFQQILDFLEQYGRECNANVIAFNYRGVGQSHGTVSGAQDLISDGLAVFDHLVHARNADPSRILLHGWSLGGGVGAAVQAAHPASMLVSDRSFSSLAAVAGTHIRRHVGLGAVVFGVISFIGAYAHSPLIALQGVSCRGGAGRMVLASVAAAALGASGSAGGAIAAGVVRFFSVRSRVSGMPV
jgi:hypothetical protein